MNTFCGLIKKPACEYMSIPTVDLCRIFKGDQEQKKKFVPERTGGVG